jgi:outer membrane protein OmpA-like peptidoglycan-associated protein
MLRETKMSDSPASGEGERKSKPSNGSDSKFNELRNILFPERTQIDTLHQQIENPEFLAEKVSGILPNAIRIRASRDDELTDAMSSPVEQAIRNSVRKNPKPLVDAIFPVMGPAIRRAISAAITGLIQSFNQTLEYSLSIRGLRWRWEAIRTGKPFAEIVMLHSLLYRVEQVFLIHRETGLLLQHVSLVPSQSADLISGMLTAIQEFARDSFHVREAETLESLQVGDLNVWVEQSPYAILAAVIRGNAPQDLRSTLQTTLETIAIEKGRALREFQGDSAPFESVRSDLENCLISQYHERKKKRSSFAAVFAGVTGLAIIFLLAVLWIQHHRFQQLVDHLRQEPGIVITSVEKRDGKYLLSGLRDPLASDGKKWITESGLDPSTVVLNFQPYQSMDPVFVLTRSKKILNPPKGIELDFRNGALIANGTAPHAWIAESRRLARVIPGVDRFDESHLLEAEAQEMYALKKQIDSHVFRFTVGTADLLEGQDEIVRATAKELDRLSSVAVQMKKDLKVQIIGHTDTTGDEKGNRQLSTLRAETIIQLFSSKGIPINIFDAVGKASDDPVRPEENEQDREWNRSVTFRVTWSESE